ncbi:MAG: homoserine dehydrogenase [Desulfarculales bacterium]|nr:homoserine dehydrogenase [Desulfarculales bacterium]
MKDNSIKIGLFGLGTIGGGVAELIMGFPGRWKERLGVDLILHKAMDLNPDNASRLGIGQDQLTDRPEDITNNPDVDIVVELVGGTGAAREIVTASLNAGKPVVTANKALLATHGGELFSYARQRGLKIAFEASVGGGIPLIRSLREGLGANQITQCLGILNGTCNYILTRMTNEGAGFHDVLADAQRLGYAEADPSFDVGGTDTAHKLAIMAALATGRLPRLDQIKVEGITSVTPLDISFAKDMGFVIKLLAVLQIHEQQANLSVYPALIENSHQLAAVNGPFNAVFVHGDWVGDIMLYGAGAGRRATASAIVADILDLAREKLSGGSSLPAAALGRADFDPEPLAISSRDDISGKYYFRFAAHDKPGVLAALAAVLGDNQISIATMIQKGREQEGGAVPIVILTHEARESAVLKAIKAIDSLPVVDHPTIMLRVI